MAPTSQKNRNYRRQPAASSSQDDDSDPGFRHPSAPPPARPLSVVAVSFSTLATPVSAPSSSSSGYSGGADEASAAPGRGRGDGDDGRRRGSEGEGEGAGGRGREVSQSLEDLSERSLNGALESAAPSTRQGGLHNGAKRIASGVGYDMLKSMGWRENTGLGQSSNGIVDPILPTTKPNHVGIGFNATAAHDAAQEEIRRIQKAKREERDRKQKLKLEKAEVAEEEAVFMRESFVAVLSTSSEYLDTSGDGLHGTSVDPHHSKVPAAGKGHKSTEPGQCPHCGQRFDTKHALKSHINARHGKVLLAARRQPKKERRKGGHRSGGTSSQSGKRGSARGLAPMSQDFSVYD